MAPINLPNGNQVSEIVLPNGATASEVIAPDGSTVFADIPDSAVARWEFEQDLTDSWNSNDLTQNGGSFVTDAAVGSYAYSLDGSSDFADLAQSVVSSFPFTFSIWVQTSDGSGDNHAITVADGSVGNNFHGIGVRGGNASIFAYNGNFTSTGSVNVADGTYHMVTGVFESDTITVYADDGSGVSTAHSEAIGQIDRTDIGRSGDSTPGDYFQGELDDGRVYDKALAQTEVADLYNTGSI